MSVALQQPRSSPAQMWDAAERAWSRLDALASTRMLSAIEQADWAGFLSLMRFVNAAASDASVMAKIKAIIDASERAGTDIAVNVPERWRA